MAIRINYLGGELTDYWLPHNIDVSDESGPATTSSVCFNRRSTQRRRYDKVWYNGKVNGVQQLATSLTAAETQQLTGHMGSRSVTCHPAEVTFSSNATHRATAGLESGLVSRRLRLSESDATGPNKTRMR